MKAEHYRQHEAQNAHDRETREVAGEHKKKEELDQNQGDDATANGSQNLQQNLRYPGPLAELHAKR